MSPQTDCLIGQAYFLRFDAKAWDAQRPYAPLGALYAAAVVRQRGYRVALFDAMLAESEAEWAAALDRHRPRVAVIYEDSFNYLSKMCLSRMREAALTMIDAARARGITTIVAGSDATDHPSPYLDRGAAAVIVGEGEATLVETLDAVRARRDLRQVAGLCLNTWGPGASWGPDSAGPPTRTIARATIRDLDTLPTPAWDLVDVEKYRAVWRRAHGYYSMNVVTTRGCPYHCNWCAKPVYGQRYTARSPEHVVAELRWLKETYRPDHIWMADDLFGLKPGWIERFAALARSEDAVVPFKCLLRADQVTSAIAATLRTAGCETVWIGAESGSQRTLDAMEKGIRVDQIAAAARLLHDADVKVAFFLQFGYPGETLEDIERTLQMVRDCRPDDIGISVSYPLPGTPFFERVRASLGPKQHWVDSDDLAMLYQATYVPEFYRALHSLVHAEFKALHARSAASYVKHRVARPIWRWRVDRLARLSSPRPTPAPLPVLTRQAAAVPTDQSSCS